MVPLFLIEMFGYNVTFVEAGVAVMGVIVGASTLFKAIKDIREMGIRPALKKLKDWLLFRRNQKKMFDALDEKLEAVLGQVTTNGGSSLKDIVLSTAERVEETCVTVQKMRARIDHQDERSPQPIFHLKAKGEMCYTNCAFRELVDAEERDLQFLDYFSHVHIPDRVLLDMEITDAIAKKRPFDVTVRFRRQVDVVPVRLEASPHVVSGELLGFFGTASKGVGDPACGG